MCSSDLSPYVVSADLVERGDDRALLPEKAPAAEHHQGDHEDCDRTDDEAADELGIGLDAHGRADSSSSRGRGARLATAQELANLGNIARVPQIARIAVRDGGPAQIGRAHV